MNNNKTVLSVVVENNSGVLARISSLFGRRGFNIDSLTVSATNDPNISRITIVVGGDEKDIQQIISQTMKLEETKDIYEINSSSAIMRELLLVKMAVDENNLTKIHEIADIYKASIVDLSLESMIIELTGLPHKIDAFLDVIGQYKIIEICRTGITAMDR